MRQHTTPAALAAALICASAATVAQASTYDFSFTQGSYTAAQGKIETKDTANGDGGFDVVGISGTIEGNTIAGPDNTSSELFPNTPAALVNSTGIAIDVPNAFLASPYTIFFGPEDLGDPVGTVNYQLGTPFFGSLGGTFNVTSVPEPSSWLLMMAGIGGAGLIMRRAKRTATAA